MRYYFTMLLAAVLFGCDGTNRNSDVVEVADEECDPARQINPRENCLEALERRTANCPQSQPEHGTVEECLAEAEAHRARCDELPDELVAAGCVDTNCVSRKCTPANSCGKCTLGRGCVSYYEGKRCGWSWGQCFCKTVVTGPTTCACRCK